MNEIVNYIPVNHFNLSPALIIKVNKRKVLANEELDHEQHLLPHATCTACTLAQEMEAVAAQLIIEKENSG